MPVLDCFFLDTYSFIHACHKAIEVLIQFDVVDIQFTVIAAEAIDTSSLNILPATSHWSLLKQALRIFLWEIIFILEDPPPSFLVIPSFFFCSYDFFWHNCLYKVHVLQKTSLIVMRKIFISQRLLELIKVCLTMLLHLRLIKVIFLLFSLIITKEFLYMFIDWFLCHHMIDFAFNLIRLVGSSCWLWWILEIAWM